MGTHANHRHDDRHRDSAQPLLLAESAAEKDVRRPVAIPLGLLALPAVALAALMVKLVDPGPAFYVQKRIGHNGKTVKVFKLRTMYADSERLLEEHLRRDPQARAEWQRFSSSGAIPGFCRLSATSCAAPAPTNYRNSGT